MKQCSKCGKVLPKSDFYPKQGICKTCERDRKWLLSSGMTPIKYLDFYNKQDGCCAICGEPPEDKLLAVDHDHSTGKVRGLLCSKCNMALGLFKDSPTNLRKALMYLGYEGYEGV